MPQNIQQLDEQILFFIQEHLKNPALDRIMVFTTSLGNAGVFWIAAAFLLMFFKRYQKCGIAIFCTLTISGFLGDNILKPLISRVRPCTKFPDVPLLIHAPHSPSFPSGHTMVGFACAAILFYYDRRLGAAGFIIAALIAFSRLYLFVHYPSDILGGILFGILTSILIIKAINAAFCSPENSSHLD
jgi:undecaprenyl-diphosphatase